MPLIISSLLGIQILASIRDPIVIGFDLPLQLILVDIGFILVIAILRLWLLKKNPDPKFVDPIIFFVVVLAAIKALDTLAVQAEPLPFYMAIYMFALALCFLSYFYLYLSAAIFLIGWLFVAFQVLTIIEVSASFFAISVGFCLAHMVLTRRISARAQIFELEGKVKELESILPMCASCKKTRNEAGEWKSIEQYIEDQESGLQVSHGVCPECSKDLYGDLLNDREQLKN
ncbi:MAG: hypothetical protein HOF74_01420 [Gammaproteobacteria bacterium]|nr:hypothetical protein [Gammaproteobacteria bacterium]MBT3858467.1 hypothetical protein [Gammaproteobacteria bacterium]MBT3986795.1 hypothetical protein [Gammaproteobacteria bacterium]MBT4582018.1 hypothetical protein [Gammaproteobacteria bacterium]MBT4657614.1 hypothetical protein [Gammaproteobacteria bacterium]